MTTTLVQENAEGTRLQLRIEPGQPPKLRLITKNEVEVLFWRYEYWEVDRATRDFWTLTAFMWPGEGIDVEETVSGNAAGEHVPTGQPTGATTGRVLRPRKQRGGGKGTGAQIGAVTVPTGDAHGG